MADASSNFEIIPNKSAKSAVWKMFGFVKTGQEVDRKKVACVVCRTVLKFSGNTTNLADHVKRKHPSQMTIKPTTDSSWTLHKNDSDLKQSSLMIHKLPPKSSRAIKITDSIMRFIIKDLRPFSVVQNVGFKYLLSTLEPRYTVPSRQYFSDTALPKLYEEVKQSLVLKLKSAVTVSLTTDGWTNRATESFVTITVTHINEEWNLENYVLQVCQTPNLIKFKLN